MCFMENGNSLDFDSVSLWHFVTFLRTIKKSGGVLAFIRCSVFVVGTKSTKGMPQKFHQFQISR